MCSASIPASHTHTKTINRSNPSMSVRLSVSRRRWMRRPSRPSLFVWNRQIPSFPCFHVSILCESWFTMVIESSIANQRMIITHASRRTLWRSGIYITSHDYNMTVIWYKLTIDDNIVMFTIFKLENWNLCIWSSRNNVEKTLLKESPHGVQSYKLLTKMRHRHTSTTKRRSHAMNA